MEVIATPSTQYKTRKVDMAKINISEYLEKTAERLLASGLDPLNSLLFSIAMEDLIQCGNDSVIIDSNVKIGNPLTG